MPIFKKKTGGMNMVKRVVDTNFWMDMQVIENYSIEDKYFSLYLMTNDKSTQVGIYALPKKVMSFETGFTSEIIQVLLDRFSQSYNKILYSEKTQEIALLDSLEVSLLKGGKPVSDLLERELSNVKDADLILATYEQMKDFWGISKRMFDQRIKELFENELELRGLSVTNREDNQIQKQKQKHNKDQIHNNKHNNNQMNNHNNNHSHNQESWSTNRGTNRENGDEIALLDDYANYLKKSNPDIEQEMTPENILRVYYQEIIGEINPTTEKQLGDWERSFPTSLILEALNRSLKAVHILPYATTILTNWQKAGVQTYRDVVKLEKQSN